MTIVMRQKLVGRPFVAPETQYHAHGMLARSRAIPLLAALGAMLLGGCYIVSSREPLYDPAKDRVFDRGLIGWWDGPELELDIASDEDRAYTITFVAPEHPEDEAQDDDAVDQPATADLVRLEGATYFFLTAPPWPTLSAEDREAWKTIASMPSWRVERFGDVLRLSTLDYRRLIELLAAEPDRVKHEVWRGSGAPPTRAQATDVNSRPWVGGLTLTDSPARIRQFLKEHREELWIDAPLLQRAQQPSASATD